MRQEGKTCCFISLVFECCLTSRKILRGFKIDFKEFPEHVSKEIAPYFIVIYVWNGNSGRN